MSESNLASIGKRRFIVLILVALAASFTIPHISLWGVGTAQALEPTDEGDIGTGNCGDRICTSGESLSCPGDCVNSQNPLTGSSSSDLNYACSKISSVKITGTIVTQGTGTSRLYAAGQPITITGTAEQFSSTCIGSKITCRTERDLACVPHDSFLKTSYEPQACPRNLPEKIWSDSHSDWKWGKILRIAAIAMIFIAPYLGPIAGPGTSAGGTLGTHAWQVQQAATAAMALSPALDDCIPSTTQQQALRCITNQVDQGSFVCPTNSGNNRCRQYQDYQQCNQQCYNRACIPLQSDPVCGGNGNPSLTGCPSSEVCQSTCTYAGSGIECSLGSGTGMCCDQCPGEYTCQDSVACSGAQQGTCNINGHTGACCSENQNPSENPTPDPSPTASGYRCDSDSACYSDYFGCTTYCDGQCNSDVQCGNPSTGRVIAKSYSSFTGAALAQYNNNQCNDPLDVLRTISWVCLPRGTNPAPPICSTCGKTYPVAVSADPRCTGSDELVSTIPNQEFKCSAASCGAYTGQKLEISIRGPDGREVKHDSTTTDATGKYSYTFNAPAVAGRITIMINRTLVPVQGGGDDGGGGGVACSNEPDDILDAVQAARALYGASPGPAELSDILNRAAYTSGNGWGLVSKPGGHNCPFASGPISCDLLLHQPSGNFYDVLEAADDGGPAKPMWGCSGKMDPSNWVAPVPPGTGNVVAGDNGFLQIILDIEHPGSETAAIPLTVNGK